MLLPSAPTYIRNNDVEHEYRADSDLYYLSGFAEPGALMALYSEHDSHRFVLFVRPRDPAREIWDGPRAGVEGALADYGADHAADVATLGETLYELLMDRQRIYYAIGRDRAMDEVVLRALHEARRRARRGRTAPTEMVEPSTLVHELRWKKSDDEIAHMERGAAITAEGFVRAMEVAKPGAFEFEVEAALRGTFRRRGAERCAYEPIVASGPNACVLHHIRNDREMRDGDLLLIDAGAEVGGYACDVTRTFPVNGAFSEGQRALYDAVLSAQREAIASVRPGASLVSVHQVAVRALTASMIALGLLEGSLEERLADESYKRYYMHGTSHWLGMDVHDVGMDWLDGEPRKFEPGCVLTVEPGIYVPVSDDRAPAALRGIGIRIEDDVLVTRDGARVLTAAIEKDPDALERLLKAR